MICVDTYTDGVPQGKIYGTHLDGKKSFDSLMQLLVALDETLDEATLPRSFSRMRRFVERESTPKSERAEKISAGKLATFSVKILFRQNASWQGYVSWLEGNSEEGFRSALEFIFLMNSVLESKETKANEIA